MHYKQRLNQQCLCHHYLSSSLCIPYSCGLVSPRKTLLLDFIWCLWLSAITSASQFKLKKGSVVHLDPNSHSAISPDPVFNNSTYFYMLLNIIVTSCCFYISSSCMLIYSISPEIIDCRICLIFTIILSH